MKKINFLIAFAISSIGFSQTILNQSETSSRTVQDPQTVIMLPGFHATSTTVNPFIAKIGNGEESGGPIDSGAGGNNPSGTVGTNYFHDTQGSIEVNGGGQLQFTLPIALPPGVKSVAPQVNLGYTSGSGNGIAGYGWNISGITSISRMGKTIEKDGELKGVQLDYSDYYSFNGQRLILKTGEYGKDGAEYQTEKYSNVKIKSFGVANNILQILPMPRYWEVTFEDGSQAWYGQIETIQDDSRTPIEYNITKWKDAQGNYITYNYTQSNNVAVISSIQWGGNETLNKPHFNEIIFNYNTRDFKEASYVAGTQFIQDKLLSNVIVKTNGTQFKKYEIAYKKLGNNYQFVDSVTEKNSQDQSANAVIFENQTDNFNQPATFAQDSRFDDIYESKISGDFNGDGKMDFFKDNTLMFSRFEGGGNFITTNFYITDSNSTYSISNSNLTSSFKEANGVLNPKDHIFNFQYQNGNKKIYLNIYGFDNNNFVLKKNIEINTAGFTSLYQINNIPTLYCSSSGVNITQYKYAVVNTYNVDSNGDGIIEPIIRIKQYYNRICGIPGMGGVTQEFLGADTLFQINYETGQMIELDSSIKPQVVADFNGDGRTDILSVSDNIVKVYEKSLSSNQYSLSFSTTKESLDEIIYLGDFNGDGKTDILAPIAQDSSDWRMYISTGNGFRKEYYSNLFLYQPTWQGPPRKNRNKQRTYSTSDLNKDGKSDFTIFESQVWYKDCVSCYEDRDSSYGFNYLRNEGVDANGKPIFSNVYNIAPKESTYWGGNNSSDEDINFSGYGEHYIPLFGNFRIAQLNTDFVIIHKTKLITWDLGSKLNKISKIKSITQGGLKTDIEYANLTSTGNIYKSFYDTNPVQYPYVNITENLNYDVVSRLIQGDRKQDFRYRDMVGHLTGKGMLGFRQTARSTFYADGFENTKVWSGSEMNPLNEALPLKDWSIKTNDENAIFPSDISLNNTQLLSYKDYQYKIDKLLNGVVVTSYTDADKPKIVTSINPYITTSKDFQKDIKTVHTVERYNSIYLPEKSTTNINDGFAITTTELAYNTPNYTVGGNYAIGKPLWKTETMQVYGDTKGGKEEYEYNGNLLTKKRTYNRDLSEYIEESYLYDGFGNIIQKTVENPYNNDDVQAATTKSQYEDKGRFVIKKTDNLGLETNITYNDWGLVLTQKDPLNNTLTNTYDSWGKLLTSKTNLGGTTTYTYEKLSNGDAKVTEYSPDNDQKITYTNKLGQNYKSSVKGFAENSYVSQEVQYDVLGRKIKESEPYFEGTSASKWNVTEYDDYSRPIKITQYTGKITTSSYSGRTVTATETNANNRFKTQVFDAIGNVTSTTDKGGTIEFKYNAAGENIESKYDKNVVTTQYDNWGRKSLFDDPSNGIYQYEYNGYGQLIHTTSPKGHKYYNYDEFGRLYNQYEVSNDNTSTKKNINITYNGKGLITNKSGTSNGQAYSSYVNYDANGRVISSGENSNGRYFYKKAIAYDDKGRITSYEKGMLSSGVNTKTVLENRYSNWSGEMYQLKDKNSSKVLWELTETNAKGLVLKAKLGASSIENTYDANNFLSNVSHTTIVNGVTNTALQIAYSFNAIKNELNSRATGGNFNILESFTYDDNNRLVNWTNPKTGQLSNNVYDAKGRIIENDQLGTIKYDDNSTTIYRPTGATLNANGQQNLTNDLIQSITYNENNDPIKITGEKGDVYFTYGLTNMRQAVGYGGKLDWIDEGHYTKYYSEDGSYEVVLDNTTGKEKHVMYIGGTSYEANIVYLKNYTESSGSYKFLHKDYLGSILAITDEDGNIKEQRHFDAWGNLTHFKVNGVNKNVNEFNNLSLIDRGYTSHEHFTEVGIIHMNGRLYDPLLRRFLNADEFIQDPQNTQVYNKYAYVVNNPLLYADVSGEDFGLSLIIAAAVAAFVSVGTDYYLNRPVDIGNLFQSVVMAVVSAGVSNGIGEIFKAGDTIAKALKGWTWVARAGAHAIAQGTLSYMQGGNFLSGALAGAFASVANDLLGNAIKNSGEYSVVRSKGFALITGAVSGGVGSVLGGGNFWMGAGQGLIVTAFNFLAHKESNNETMASDESSPDNGYDENGKKINNNGGNTTDYLYDKNGNVISSTDVKRVRLTNELAMPSRSYGYDYYQGGGALYDPSWDMFQIYAGAGELKAGYGVLKMGLTRVLKSEVGIRTVLGASPYTLKSSVFFEGALGSRSINMLGVKSLPTLYGTAYTWGTFLGRNTPIIGGAIMYDGLRRIYNKFQNFGK